MTAALYHDVDGRSLLSHDGEVKLWDSRGGDTPLSTWDMSPHGLSAFDVHEQTEVFAAYVICTDCCDMFPTLMSIVVRRLSLPPTGDPSERMCSRSSHEEPWVV